MTTEPHERLEHDGSALTIFRDAPSHDGRRTAALGALRLASAGAGVALLDLAAGRLAAEGYAALLAPLDGDTWHSYRAVVESDGSPPFFLEPQSGPHDRPALDRAGFEPVAFYRSVRVDLGPVAAEGAGGVESVTVAAWDGSNPDRLLAAAFRLSSEAFARNPYFRPIAEAAFMAIYKPLIGLMDRDFVLVAKREGEIVGFLFGIPDHAASRAPSVILKTYASSLPGVGRMLADAFHGAAKRRGFDYAIHALMHEENRSRGRSDFYGGAVFRRYALFARLLP